MAQDKQRREAAAADAEFRARERYIAAQAQLKAEKHRRQVRTALPRPSLHWMAAVQAVAMLAPQQRQPPRTLAQRPPRRVLHPSARGAPPCTTLSQSLHGGVHACRALGEGCSAPHATAVRLLLCPAMLWQVETELAALAAARVQHRKDMLGQHRL